MERVRTKKRAYRSVKGQCKKRETVRIYPFDREFINKRHESLQKFVDKKIDEDKDKHSKEKLDPWSDWSNDDE
jgi:hypothetical protein